MVAEPPHVMLDIETLSTKPDAMILAIGAASFYPDDEIILNSFFVAIDISAPQAVGRMDGGTVSWWLDPDRQEALTSLKLADKVDIGSAMDGFLTWFGPAARPVWGNGAAFDNVIMRNTFEMLHMECPWAYRDDRCYRTAKNMAPEVEFTPYGTYHNPVDDAIGQALHLQKLYAWLGKSA